MKLSLSMYWGRRATRQSTKRVGEWSIFWYEDMKRTVDVVRGSNVDWIIVRVPMLTDRPATGHVRVGYVGQGTGPRLSRADMAAFILEQVNTDR